VSDINDITGRCRECGRLAATCRRTSCAASSSPYTAARESFPYGAEPPGPPKREPDVAPLLADVGVVCDICGDWNCVGCPALELQADPVAA
jgi:hypothetical protein